MPRNRELTHLLPHLIFSRVGFFKAPYSVIKVNAPLKTLNLSYNDLDDAAKTLVRSAAKEGMSLKL